MDAVIRHVAVKTGVLIRAGGIEATSLVEITANRGTRIRMRLVLLRINASVGVLELLSTNR